MKKVIIILSSVFGGIALLVLFGVLVYNNVWIQSFHNMKSDSDTHIYESDHMLYNDGTLQVMHEGNVAYDIVNPWHKKTVDRSSSEFKSVFDCGYSFELSEDKLVVKYGEENYTANFLLEDIMRSTDISKESKAPDLCRTTSKELLKYSLSTADYSYYLGVDIENKQLYVEELFHNDVTTAVLYKYDLEAEKLVETYEAVLCDNATQGVTMSRNIMSHDTVIFDDYIFFMFHFSDFCRDKLYRHDKKSGETIVVGEYEDSSFAINKSNIYYTYYIEYDDAFYDIENGIWKMDIDTLETTLVTTQYYDRELLCTENYIYAYKDMDWKPFYDVPTLTDFEIERGYDVKQIAIKSE